jgi:outer membrane protein assembly factor BamD
LHLIVPGLILIVGLLTLGACGGKREDPILRLSAAEALEQGKALLEEKSYRQARKYLIHAFEVEPNSVAGREGLLLAADALFSQDRFDSYVEAEGRYRDFLNRFPTSERADYAQFRMAQSLAQRMEKPNRDQETTRKAIAAFETLIRVYPTSRWTDEARTELAEVRNNLAEHEFIVGHFYFRRSGQNRAVSLASAAVSRFEFLLENYPDYDQKDKILAHLCAAHHRLEQVEKATEVCERLRTEYPDSKYRRLVPKRTQPSPASQSSGTP